MDAKIFFNTASTKRFFNPSNIFVGDESYKVIQQLITATNSCCIIYDEAISHLKIVAFLRDLEGASRKFFSISGPPFSEDILDFGVQNGIFETYVAIGGGSTLDFAKAVIVHRLYGSIDGIGMRDNPTPNKIIQHKPQLLCIPTTPGSGAENSRYYVTYSKLNKGKIHGKTWDCIADYVFLDGANLYSMPIPLMLVSAFDAFIHLFETFIIKNENSVFTDMISLFWMPKLMVSIERALEHKSEFSRADHDTLLMAASFAGIAISNVRTGNIHEAAGALLEKTALSHGETLFVFFEDAIKQYEDAVSKRTELLISTIKSELDAIHLSSINEVVSWWREKFEQQGITQKIQTTIQSFDKEELLQVKRHVAKRLSEDKVWNDKESPVKIGEKEIDELVNNSMDRWL